MTTTTTTRTSLERRLGPLDAAALIVSNVIGGGILFTPPQIAAAVPAALPFLSTWAAGGLLAFAGAMAYAELAALRPHAGGEYVYLREAFGRLAAFLSGWTSFVAGFSGAIATSAVVLASYFGRFAPAAGNNTPLFSLPIVPGLLTLSFSPQALVAVAAIFGMAWIHLRGVGPGRLVGNALATLKVGALLLFIAFGFSMGNGQAANLTASGPVTSTGWLLALIPVMFTYSGWNAASYVAEEVRNPGRNVPLALGIGTCAVIALYLALNALYIYVVPVEQLAAVKGSMLDLIADRLLGQMAGNIMAIVSIVSLLASISAMTFAGPRVYFAMGRDGVFFNRAASVHSKYRTPAVAILAQATWSSLLVLSAGADALVTYTGFAIVLFSGVAVVALFVLRSREPHAERPFRAWGYPVAPAIYVIASAAILLNGLIGDPATTRNGVLVILAGIPLFLWFRKLS
ncbi:MAG TPA: amino acid permease [Vicinamibacterales bacterium]|nr:amino acid permease [Vicinamibacterales bacterium]